MAETTPTGGVARRRPTARKAAGGGAATSGRGALAAGAARAGGERARRRSTPLIAGSEQSVRAAAKSAVSKPTQRATPGGAVPVVAPVEVDRLVPSSSLEQAPVPHRPSPTITSGPSKKAAAKSGGRRQRPSRADLAARRAERPLRAVPVEPVDAPSAAESSTQVVPGLDELLRVTVATLRVAANAAGVDPDDIEAQVARTLAYVRRRLDGDYTVDAFGFDADFTEHVALPLLRPLYQKWFRVEVRGIENIPRTGGALVVANHSGTVAVDSLMTQVAIHDEHPDRRFLRMLGADLVFQTPFLGTFARRSGSTVASNPDAERLLRSGELVGVWPEGFKGVGKPFKERYKLQRFGRGGFVSAAIRSQVPIVPCSIVGAEEIYPIIGNLKTVARLLGVPYVPITPTFPLLGPLGLVPLPSKWIIEFGRPVDTASLGPAAADDPMLVFDLTDQVRETIQQSLYSLLMQRRSVFF